MKESLLRITWRGGGALGRAVLLLVCCVGCACAGVVSGPSERPEAYFNGSSFIRINRPLSLTHIAGISYRTCVGGELFVQRFEGHTLHLTALLDKVVVAWTRPGQPTREQSMPLRTLDNKWHLVALRHNSEPPSLTLQLDRHERVVANASLHPWLLGSDKLQAEGATLLVGNLFSGCMYEGPQLEFHAATTVVSNVQFGPCPLATETCKDGKDVLRVPPKDHCYNEPCLLRGTCVSRHDRYECHCAARYSGNNCELDKGDPCASSPCAHGRCHEDEFGNYRCVCEPHYHGAHCELADVVDPQCKSSPCKNNGSCEVTSPGAPYMCLCPTGFSGRHCEVNDDDCAAAGAAACDNGGKCIDGIDGYTCDCADTGYRGLRCESNVNECAGGRPCGPGVCYDTYGGFVCVCPPQYTGDRCQKASACAAAPCGGGGTCVEGGDGYTCMCAPQWTGHRCEAPLTCEVLNCGPHSHCQQLMTRATCVCDPGYYGPPGVSPMCHSAASACAAGVCAEGAACRVTTDGVECACAPGHRGQYCEVAAGKTHANECKDKPCAHADICVDTALGYECACASGWGGAHCDVQTNGAQACVTSQDGYQCTCKSGRAGNMCERTTDCRTEGCPRGMACIERGTLWQCRDAPCANVDCRAGVCRSLDANQYRCECPDNYTGRHCEVDVDECAKSPKICNFGVCVNVPGAYECYCKPGYTGDSCEQDIDECLSAPCKNNATCHNMENKYECTCLEGFQGKDCSVDIDECASSPCLSGATCTDGIGKFTCACPPGITGRLCDVDIDDCESNPCHNGGRCVDKLASFECECAGTGFSGALCDTDIDECASQPCRNGATCTDQNNDYKCLCHPGFTGKDCESDIDECASSPCHYGGVCLQRSDVSLYRPAGAPPERVGPQPHMLLPASFYAPYSAASAAGYVCVCVAGTAGARCDVDVDECASSPCAHGKCEDRIGGYACRCDDGYEGEHCDVDIDECARYVPCVHGQCHDRRATYHCECADGWGGRNCSVRLKGCDGQPCRAGGTCHAWLYGETEHRYNCSCRAGRWGDTCDRVTTMSLEKSSYAEVNTTREEGYDVSFRFKTTLSSGLLAMGRGLTYFFLELSSGRLNLHSSLLNKWEGVFIGSNLNDSNWQKVFVTINSSHLVLAANEEQTIYPISQNEAYNSSVTSFPTTRLGTAGSSFATLTHGPNFFVGCFQDVVVNGQWVLPERDAAMAVAGGALLAGVQPECPRVPQCEPNPCRSGGQCRDDWTAFSCHCPRPYLGHTCQFNYTAATFGHESRPEGGRVTVAVSESARLAVHAALDISMFVRTRKPHGQVFYLGSAPGSPDETLVAASLKNGELLVHLRFNHTQEDYTVGGTRLDNGHVHLIQVVRNSTLVQVKLNGTEYFRKSISAAKQLDAQVLYIGGPPPAPTEVTTAVPAQLADDNEFFKGVIQDVQISNGVTSHVVEFFPLSSPGLALPPSFGAVRVDAGVLPGVRSDDQCVSAPCMNNATCKVTWNDYVCDCPRGYKGKQCADVEFCQLQGCPANTMCKNLQGGYECLSNATFDGAGTVLRYRLRPGEGTDTADTTPDSLSITYRSRVGGTLLHASWGDTWFSVGAYHGKVTVAWRLPPAEPQQRSMRTARGHAEEWTELAFALTAHQIKGAFVREGTEEVGISAEMNTSAWRALVTRGDILLGGVMLKMEEDTTTTVRAQGQADATMRTRRYPIGSLQTESEAEGTTEQWASDNSAGELFKGCMGPVRVGGLLLPFFSEAELFKSAASDVLRTRSHFALLEGEPWGGAPDCLLCLERSCMHGSHCKDVHRSYACSCPPGYSGDRCERDDDECLAHQCEHGATCVDRVAGYECQCPPGYTGEHCESDIDECESQPCLNGGTCTNTPGGHTCTCSAAWTGVLCDVPKHRSCRHTPCSEHATCLDKADASTGNNYTCVCAEGYSGVHCEVAYCERVPCAHGECVRHSARAHCACAAGYTGPHCETELDECALSGQPCRNGGRCIDRIAAYYCDCDGTGWQGVHCEVDVDECASGHVNCGPGVCRNHAGGYTCECEKGYCGHECKLLDPCTVSSGNASGPCERGECQQRCAAEVAHVCLCPEGWGGERCAQRLSGAAATGGGRGAIVGSVAAVGVLVLCVCVAVGLSRAARRKRATRGTYSPSGQEYCNPRANAMQHALKPPPEERLI